LIYLKDSDAFDQDYFAQSLVDDSPEYAINPENFFSFTPHKAQVIERINDLKAQTEFNGLYFRPKLSEQMSASQVIRTLQKIISISSERSRAMGEIEEAKALSEIKIVTTDDIEKFHELNIDSAQDRNPSFTRIRDSLRRLAFDQSEVYFAVFESVVSMTTYPMVGNHILNPAVNYPLDFKPFYDLFIRGASFTEFTKEIFLFVPEL
jgi:hypothetical protein